MNVWKWHRTEIGSVCTYPQRRIWVFSIHLMTASWGHSGMLFLALFDQHYCSSLIELFEFLYQLICGFSWWDMDAYRCWFVSAQNPEMTNNCLSSPPTVPSPVTKMIWVTKMRIINADVVISELFWCVSRLAQNLAFSMVAIFLPLYLTKDMSNFSPNTTKWLLFLCFIRYSWDILKKIVAIIVVVKQWIDLGWFHVISLVV